jgi:hypothetical protein
LKERGEWAERETLHGKKSLHFSLKNEIIGKSCYTFLIARIINPITKLTIADNKNGTVEPNSSHKNPAVNEPSIIAKLESIVSNPIADPRLSSGTKSETHALEMPSVAAE